MTDAKFAEQYPQHTLMQGVKHEIAVVEQFIEFLERDPQFRVCERIKVRTWWDGTEDIEHHPIHGYGRKLEELIWSAFGVDPQAFWQEKDRMLDEIRAANKEREEREHADQNNQSD